MVGCTVEDRWLKRNAGRDCNTTLGLFMSEEECQHSRDDAELSTDNKTLLLLFQRLDPKKVVDSESSLRLTALEELIHAPCQTLATVAQAS